MNYARPSPASTSVVIAHSFGGAVVHAAVRGKLVEQLTLVREDLIAGRPPRVVSALGDLTVYINAAYQATRMADIQRLMGDIEELGGFAEDQRPVVLSLTTHADLATRIAFPIGMGSSRHKGLVLDGEQRDQYCTAVGQYHPFITPGSCITCKSRSQWEPSEYALRDDSQRAKYYRAYAESARDRPEVGGEDVGLCRANLSASAQRRPVVLMFDPDGRMMTGHNDIFNSRVQSLLWNFLVRYHGR